MQCDLEMKKRNKMNLIYKKADLSDIDILTDQKKG